MDCAVWGHLQLERLLTHIDTTLLVALIAAVVALFGFLATHQLNFWRDRRNRLVSAAASFRVAIRNATVEIPSAGEHWGSEVVAHLPAVCSKIEAAVFEFKYFVPYHTRHRLLHNWQELSRHCMEEIPKVLSPAESVYSSDPSSALSAKEQFHNKIESLLSFAKQT